MIRMKLQPYTEELAAIQIMLKKLYSQEIKNISRAAIHGRISRDTSRIVSLYKQKACLVEFFAKA